MINFNVNFAIAYIENQIDYLFNLQTILYKEIDLCERLSRRLKEGRPCRLTYMKNLGQVKNEIEDNEIAISELDSKMIHLQNLRLLIQNYKSNPNDRYELDKKIRKSIITYKIKYRDYPIINT